VTFFKTLSPGIPKIQNCIILILMVVTISHGIGFRRVVEIPGAGVLQGAKCFDPDHDGRQNLVYGAEKAYFWEHVGFDRYVLEDSALTSEIYGIGYLDNDSLTDMVGNENGLWPYPLYVYESPAYDSNPTNIVWQDSGFMSIYGGNITDLDQDGFKEVLFGYDDPNNLKHYVCVYENIGDNLYSRVWQDTVNPSCYFINGDFDQDSKTDFITWLGSGWGGLTLVWECVGNDAYDLVFADTLSIGGWDIFSANDMDGNGKPEFLCTNVSFLYGSVWLYLYEAIGDNNYNSFLIDSVANLPMSINYQLSCCGDIDQDGQDEIIWSTFNQWHIYKAFGVHQYQNIFNSVWTQHDVTRISVYDLNGNGYPEVIDSWSQNGIPFLTGTTIWEIEGVRLHQPNGGEVLHPNQQYPVTWEKFDPPGADSFTLFYSIDNGNNYDTIVTGLSTNDTSFLWSVPDTVSDSCKIMIWAYGPPRQDEQMPRGTAWDFSDSIFMITDVGIEEVEKELRGVDFEISQNPANNGEIKVRYKLSEALKIRISIYNSIGQLEGILADDPGPIGQHEIVLVHNLPAGVYFLQADIADRKIVKKIVILK
jgi:hypothetical protein